MPTSNPTNPPAGRSRGPRPRRTTQPAKGPSRWLPQRKDFVSYQAWDTHYRAFEAIYALQDQMRELASQVTQAQATGRQAVNGLADKMDKGGKVDATHINGFAVKATVPKDGQVLTYKGVEGQLVLE